MAYDDAPESPLPYVYRAEAHVDAPADAVWDTLVDFGSYGQWNPFTREVRCDLVVGGPVRMRVFMDGLGTLSQTETLMEATRPHRLVWALDLGLPWLLHAQRVQTLTPSGDGTQYTTVDTIGGLLSPVVHLVFGRAVGLGFTRMAAALAERVASRRTTP